MVITLKDGTVVTLFEAREAEELIGSELYNFIKGHFSKDDEKDERIHELECENDDLYTENILMENTLSHVDSMLDDIIYEVDNFDYSNPEEKIERIKELLINVKETL